MIECVCSPHISDDLLSVCLDMETDLDIDGVVHCCVPSKQTLAQVPGEFHSQELFDHQLPVQRLRRVVC